MSHAAAGEIRSLNSALADVGFACHLCPTSLMKIAIGSDHAGFLYKEKIRDFLEERGHSVTDFGTHSEEAVDYPLFFRPVAEAVARHEFERGIVLGGSGNGGGVVGNRVKGGCCGLWWDGDSARVWGKNKDSK